VIANRAGDRGDWGGRSGAQDPGCTPNDHVTSARSEQRHLSHRPSVWPWHVRDSTKPCSPRSAPLIERCGRTEKGLCRGDQGAAAPFSRGRRFPSASARNSSGLPGPAGGKAWRAVQAVPCPGCGSWRSAARRLGTGLNAPRRPSVRRWRRSGLSQRLGLPVWPVLRTKIPGPRRANENRLAVTHERLHGMLWPARS